MESNLAIQDFLKNQVMKEALFSNKHTNHPTTNLSSTVNGLVLIKSFTIDCTHFGDFKLIFP